MDKIPEVRFGFHDSLPHLPGDGPVRDVAFESLDVPVRCDPWDAPAYLHFTVAGSDGFPLNPSRARKPAVGSKRDKPLPNGRGSGGQKTVVLEPRASASGWFEEPRSAALGHVEGLNGHTQS